VLLQVISLTYQIHLYKIKRFIYVIFYAKPYSGIGRATAIAFAQESCTKISICDRNLPGLQETQKLISEISKEVDVLVVKVDMLEESEIENMVRKTVERWGRVDYAVNAAGMYLLQVEISH
jgi:NADP-dependent 3-hydroxy acid dehydrogenase YdfG